MNAKIESKIHAHNFYEIKTNNKKKILFYQKSILTRQMIVFYN